MLRALLISLVMLAAFAAQAQAATVFQYCQDFWGCDPHFVADAGEQNNVRVSQADPEPEGSVRFEDTGALLVHPVRADYAVPGSYGRSLTGTLQNCTFAVRGATCDTQFGPEVHLGDGDDVARIEIDGQPHVDCGAGADTVYVRNLNNVVNCENVIQLSG